MRAGLNWLSAGVFALTILGSWALVACAAEKSERVLRHLVLYKFKSELTTQQVQEVIDAFSALPKQIDSIIGFERGENLSQEQKSEGFTHCFVVTFADEKGRDAYLASPAHDAYVKVVRDRREKVIVFDYWTAP
jgi:heme-degrading monooxygenase HmoA